MFVYQDIIRLANEIGRSPDWVIRIAFMLIFLSGIVVSVLIGVIIHFLRKKP